MKKKSGKWRLLHDLREINRQMVLMGPVQRGLPLPSALPRNWPVIVLDIKDCFFSIPLYQDDMVRFAFTVPSQNHSEPDKIMNGRCCHKAWQVVLLCVSYMLTRP